MKTTTPNLQQKKGIRTFRVFAIEEGTVIDHIDKGQALHIINILDLTKNNTIVTVGLNLPSKRLGYKDLIKVEHQYLTQKEVNRVAIFAPNASINIIKNFSVVDKFPITVPDIIDGLIVCPNPNCITNNEPMETIFHVTNGGTRLKFICDYCEKKFIQEDISAYNHA